MAKNLLISSNEFIILFPTGYSAVGNTYINDRSTEAVSKVTYRTAGTFSNLYVLVAFNDIANTSTARLRKNGSNGNMSVSITASTTGEFEDTSNTDTNSVGDTINYKTTLGAGAGFVIITIFSVVFEPDDHNITMTKLLSVDSAGNGLTGGAGTVYIPLFAENSPTLTESNVSFSMLFGGTLDSFYTYISTNSRTSTSTMGTRVNGSNGNQSVSITASSTGSFEDTSNSDDISVDDDVNYYLTTGSGSSGQNIFYNIVSTEFYNYRNRRLLLADKSVADFIDTFSVRFTFLAGRLFADLFEVSISSGLNISGRTEKFRIVVTQASDGLVRITLRINRADSSHITEIPASTTGTFENNEDKLLLSPTDNLNYEFTNFGTVTQLGYRNIGLVLSEPLRDPILAGGVIPFNR